MPGMYGVKENRILTRLHSPKISPITYRVFIPLRFQDEKKGNLSCRFLYRRLSLSPLKRCVTNTGRRCTKHRNYANIFIIYAAHT